MCSYLENNFLNLLGKSISQYIYYVFGNSVLGISAIQNLNHILFIK